MLAKLIYNDPKTRLKLLAKTFKTKEEYHSICIKDAQLEMKAIDIGKLKYVGQVRYMQVYQKTEDNQSSS